MRAPYGCTDAGRRCLRLVLLLVSALCVSGPAARAAELRAGDVFFVDHDAGVLGHYDPIANMVFWDAIGFVELYDLAVSPRNQRIYIVEEGFWPNATPSTLWQMDYKSGGAIVPLLTDAPGALEGVAVSPDGRLYVGNVKTREILQIDPDTLEQERLPIDACPFRLAAAGNGDLYVLDGVFQGAGQVRLLRYNVKTHKLNVISSDFCSPWDMDLGPDGSLYVVDDCWHEPDWGVIFRIDPRTGAQKIFARGGNMGACFGIAANEYGELFVADGGGALPTFGGALLRVAPSGNISVMWDPDWAAVPMGIAVVPPVANLIALEVNQTIQDWKNSVPLIEGKRTIVRAHLESTGSQPVHIQARLEGVRDGAELPGSPLSAINAGGWILASTNAVERRGTLDDSLNFDLPSSWLSGTVRLRLVWDTGCLVGREPAELGGQAGDCAVVVTFTPQPVPTVEFLCTTWTETSGVTHTVDPGEVPAFAERLAAIWPIRGSTVLTSPYTVAAVGEPETCSFADLLEGKALMDWAEAVLAGHGDVPPLLYGIIANGTDGCAADIPSRAACGRLPPNPAHFDIWLQPHESAHCMGQSHPVDARLGLTPAGDAQGTCGEPADAGTPPFPYLFDEITPTGTVTWPYLGPMAAGEEALIYGLDSLHMSVMEPQHHFELMSYCDYVRKEYVWISVATYNALRTSIAARFGTIARALHTVTSTDYFLIRGELDRDTGAVAWWPILPVRGTANPAPPVPGEYLLELRDAAGTLLSQVPFALITPSPDPPCSAPRPGRIRLAVLADEQIREITVRHNDQVLSTRTASPRHPELTILRPRGGEALTGAVVRLQWEASDPDGDPLTYTVQFSADGGDRWEVLDLDLSSTWCDVDLRRLKGTSQGRIRVIASDSFNSSTAVSDLFTVRNHAPEIRVTSPPADSLFSGRQVIRFAAVAQDREDGSVTGTNLVWTSDLDGPLGTGEVLHREAADLSRGTHRITVTATDAAGESRSASVPFTIASAVRPRLLLTEVSPGTKVRLRIRGDAFAPYRLEVSTDLRDWQTLSTNSSPTGMADVEDPAATGTRRFYRASQLPLKGSSPIIDN